MLDIKNINGGSKENEQRAYQLPVSRLLFKNNDAR